MTAGPAPGTFAIRPPSSSRLIAPLIFLGFCGPALLFPDVVPAPWRTSVVTVLTVLALALGLVLLRPRKAFAWGVGIFVAATLVSWMRMPAHDVAGIRHFAGIGLGVLVMASTAAWSRSRDRLMITGICFAVSTIAVLTLGSLGTIVNLKKFAGDTQLEPVPLGLPSIKLGLPGLEQTGHVNPNALAGTALMLLPTCAAVAGAALLGGRHRRVALLAGSLATFVAASVFAMTLSRTALLAGVLTVVMLGFRRSRHRWRMLIVLLVAAAALGWGFYDWKTAAPQEFEKGMRSARLRVDIWHDAVDRLRSDPWLGVGINQFHNGLRLAGPYGVIRVPHAHNMFVQVALDIGIVGLCGYLLLLACLVRLADRSAQAGGVAGRIAAGAGLSLVAAHMFGLGDAIALGAKVGVFQWLCSGMILAASHLVLAAPETVATIDRIEQPAGPYA